MLNNFNTISSTAYTLFLGIRRDVTKTTYQSRNEVFFIQKKDSLCGRACIKHSNKVRYTFFYCSKGFWKQATKRFVCAVHALSKEKNQPFKHEVNIQHVPEEEGPVSSQSWCCFMKASPSICRIAVSHLYRLYHSSSGITPVNRRCSSAGAVQRDSGPCWVWMF